MGVTTAAPGRTVTAVQPRRASTTRTLVFVCLVLVAFVGVLFLASAIGWFFDALPGD